MITENEIKETLRHKTTAPQSLLLQIVDTFSRKTNYGNFFNQRFIHKKTNDNYIPYFLIFPKINNFNAFKKDADKLSNKTSQDRLLIKFLFTNRSSILKSNLKRNYLDLNLKKIIKQVYLIEVKSTSFTSSKKFNERELLIVRKESSRMSLCFI